MSYFTSALYLDKTQRETMPWRGSGQSGHPASQGSHDNLGCRHGSLPGSDVSAFPNRGDFCVCEVLTSVKWTTMTAFPTTGFFVVGFFLVGQDLIELTE